jgi:hypothetical protein
LVLARQVEHMSRSTNEMDFDGIALRLAARVGSAADSAFVPAVAEELRLVWNARGAVDISRVEAELTRTMGVAAAGPHIECLDSALRLLDFPIDGAETGRNTGSRDRAIRTTADPQPALDVLEPVDAVRVVNLLLGHVVVRLNDDEQVRTTSAGAIQELDEASRLIDRAIQSIRHG